LTTRARSIVGDPGDELTMVDRGCAQEALGLVVLAAGNPRAIPGVNPEAAVVEGQEPDGKQENQTVNPRLIDKFDLEFVQEDVPFLIPHLREDIRLAIDPFLLWKSDLPEYQQLHKQLVDFLDQVRRAELTGRRPAGVSMLLRTSEAKELGLGYGTGTKAGSGIGPSLAVSIMDTYRAVPQLIERGLTHIEMLGLLVPKVAEDRVSDLTASILKRYFIDYTRQQAESFSIPTSEFALDNVWDAERLDWRVERTRLPYNPIDGSPILLPPLDMLRHLPWINYEDYYRSSFARFVLPADTAGRKVAKTAVLGYNRDNFTAVEQYVAHKESTAPECSPAALFDPLRLETLKRKMAEVRALPTGKADGSDKKYEDRMYDLLSSLLYSELEYAASQVRTVSGAHIRDIIFYNDGKTPFLADVRQRFSARQIVFELKNVREIGGEHVNQLYRYLDDEFGQFGVIVTRNPLPSAVKRNIVDLHSSKRAVILVLHDGDIELMVNALESNRRPVEVLTKAYVEFSRWLPK
jgi:hypothetical protein